MNFYYIFIVFFFIYKLVGPPGAAHARSSLSLPRKTESGPELGSSLMTENRPETGPRGSLASYSEPVRSVYQTRSKRKKKVQSENRKETILKFRIVADKLLKQQLKKIKYFIKKRLWTKIS